MDSKLLIESATIIFNHQEQFKVSIKRAPILSQASYSYILSLAYDILKQQPNLFPPNFDNIKPFHTSKCGFLNDLFEPWCDYLYMMVQKGNTIQIEGNIYVIALTNEEYFHKISNKVYITKKLNSKEFSKQGIIEKLFQLKIKQSYQPKLKIGIANMGYSQLKNQNNIFQPKFNLSCIIAGIWFANQQWKNFKILKQQYPTKEQLLQIDVIIITGSAYSVLDNHASVQNFMQLLKEALNKKKSLKVIGLCFGHQLIVKHFNGKVITKERRGGIHKISIIKNNTRKHQILQELSQFPYEYLHIIQFNGDFVVTKPENFICLAFAENSEFQALISQDQRFLTLQFHCEYSKQYTQTYYQRTRYYNSHQYKDLSIQKSQEVHTQSLKCIRNVVKKFINSCLIKPQI